MFVSNQKGLVHALVLGLAATSAAAAEPPADQDVSGQLNSIRSQLDRITTLQHDLERQQQILEQKQQEQAALNESIRDADRRTQFLDGGGLTSGYSDGRFLLRSEDGNFLLHPWAQFQFRNTTTYREDAKPGGRDDLQNGFEVRRLKFGVDGNLFGQDLTYFFQFAVDRHTGNVGLEMAWVKYHFADTPFAVRAGQFKDPLDHEQLTASRFFPAIDRTLVDDTFANGEGFVKGVSAIYDPGNSVRAEAAFTGGLRNFNTNFQQFPTSGIPSDWGAAARGEYKLFGNWSDYERMSAYGITKDSLVFGAGADYTETGHGSTELAEVSDALVHVVDAQYQSARGLTIYAAYLGRYSARIASKNSKGTVDAYDPTARFQVSWALGPHWEPYGRYEYIHFNGHEFPAGTQTNVHVITGGVNYYLYGTLAKLSLDLSYLPNGSPISDDGFGILVDNNHNELVGRAQLQVVF